MKLSHLLTAAGAAALLTGAAHAQTQPTQPATDWPAGEANTDVTARSQDITTDTSLTADTSPAGQTPVTAPVAEAATTYAQGVSVTTTTITNGPVPDTAENRARYGQPLSRAGRMTETRGN